MKLSNSNRRVEFACLEAERMDSLETAIALVKSATAPGTAAHLLARFQRAILEEPEEVKVRLKPAEAQFLARDPGQHVVWLVVKDDPQSVFYDPVSGDFGACWGPDIATGEYLDLAMRSVNPFEMFIA